MDKLEIICDDLDNNPQCAHGPTLLFRRRGAKELDEDVKEYYACSAYRDLKECNFYMTKEDYEKRMNNSSSFKRFTAILDDTNIIKIREQTLLKKPEDRMYCHTCSKFVEIISIPEHESHDILKGISDEILNNPTKLLKPCSNNKREAQYFFTKKTIEFLVNCIAELNFRKIICLGVPTLHEHFRNKKGTLKVESFLLDLDHRYYYFYDEKEYACYNMFNNYFLHGNKSKDEFEKFLRVKRNEQILLITDPPFGCRTEPLVKTIKEISYLYQRINNFRNILSIFWIFPYFMEFYIKKFMPEMEMIDFKVNYTNHDEYNEDGRKYGSPVRVFTNIPLNLVVLPKLDGYKFCEKCKRWTGIENIHCNICKECPSKNGETYRHCSLCEKCVKPNYKHCNNCGRCTQNINHNCNEYQKNLNCWICRKPGHSEKYCSNWVEFCKRNKKYRRIFNNLKRISKRTSLDKRTCFICTKLANHNEKNCPRRKTLLKEHTFLGIFENIFDKNTLN